MSVSVTISTTPRYTYYHTYCMIWPETTEFQDLATTVGICGTWSRYYNSYEGFLLVSVFIASALVNCFLYGQMGTNDHCITLSTYDKFCLERSISLYTRSHLLVTHSDDMVIKISLIILFIILPCKDILLP